jgi:predicted O-linked N-acetylglucosamine transferase (SPINDLY family)
LDTFPYNAGTTASDALWVGLPVLTFAGDSFASRMAASALMGVGMVELITHSMDDYVKRAIELGNHPGKLIELKEQLKQKKPDSALFNTPQFVRRLENIYQIMVERAASGQSPQNIEIV